jgi:hypothetical protein
MNMRIREYKLILKVVESSKVDLRFEFRIWGCKIDSEGRRIFESLVRLIFSKVRYQNERIGAVDGVLILENWIKSGMEAGF